MKYRTKVDIPLSQRIIKSGAILENIHGVYSFKWEGKTIGAWYADIVELHPEFFEPIQEPRWTDDDMIDFGTFGFRRQQERWPESLIEFKKMRGL